MSGSRGSAVRPSPRPLYRLQQRLAVIESLVVGHKGTPPVVRAWNAALTASRSALTASLVRSSALEPERQSAGVGTPIDMSIVVKPLSDIVQRYVDAGAALLTTAFECLLDCDALFEPGACLLPCRSAYFPFYIELQCEWLGCSLLLLRLCRSKLCRNRRGG